MSTRDPRHDLERLPSESLYALARNEAAAHRKLALRVLIERGSDYALQPEVAEEARELVLNDPIILKRSNPAIGVTSLSMPGVLDVLADNQTKRAELTELVDQNHAASTRSLAALESLVTTNHAASLQALADETGALGQAVVQAQRQLRDDIDGQIAALGAAVTANKEASERALHQARINIWKYVLHRAWQTAEDIAAQKIAFDSEIATLRDQHDKAMRAAEERLRLLERSPWQKFVDWWKARRSKPDPVIVEQDAAAAFQERVKEMIRQS